MGLNQIVLLAANVEEKSLGERMGTALLNTVMGIAIVFIVLLLISALISCFKYINKFEMRAKSKKEQAAVSSAPVETTTASVEEVEEDLADDLELVAVITAAIHAYEEAQGNDVPADGLVVRNIRRVNRTKWQNA